MYFKTKFMRILFLGIISHQFLSQFTFIKQLSSLYKLFLGSILLFTILLKIPFCVYSGPL